MVTSWRALQLYGSVKEGKEDHKIKVTSSELPSLKGNAIFSEQLHLIYKQFFLSECLAHKSIEIFKG